MHETSSRSSLLTSTAPHPDTCATRPNFPLGLAFSLQIKTARAVSHPGGCSAVTLQQTHQRKEGEAQGSRITDTRTATDKQTHVNQNTVQHSPSDNAQPKLLIIGRGEPWRKEAITAAVCFAEAMTCRAPKNSAF